MLKVVITWEQVELYVELLATQIKETQLKAGPITKILGVTRGGLIPAVMLAHRLGISQVRSVNPQVRPDGPYKASMNSPHTLVVDEICDTGETLRYINKHLPEARIGVLIDKRHRIPGQNLLHYVGRWMQPTMEGGQQYWVVFPWEERTNQHD